MSEVDDVTDVVEELFKRHFRSYTLDNINQLGTVLPENAAILRNLGWRCLEESRDAMRKGKHLAGRRLDVLGRQLHARANELDHLDH